MTIGSIVGGVQGKVERGMQQTPGMLARFIADQVNEYEAARARMKNNQSPPVKDRKPNPVIMAVKASVQEFKTEYAAHRTR